MDCDLSVISGLKLRLCVISKLPGNAIKHKSLKVDESLNNSETGLYYNTPERLQSVAEYLMA